MTDARSQGRAMFDDIAAEHLGAPGIDMGPLFGTEGIRVRGKVFAFVVGSGELVAKVPAARATSLVAEGRAARMVMRDRELREWVTLPMSAGDDAWAVLMREARAYVDEITPERGTG